jgi:YebC/PmpR family DNA-binding regulatory protein
MSGHSKWSTIKHQKAITDQKRGKIFSKLGKAIAVAAKQGASGDPETNAKLRLAMEQARAANMPKENVKRAIEKGLGTGGDSGLQVITYEGFGPEKTAIIVECITDNKNRTAAEIKSFFERAGGNLGVPGSATYMFEKNGLILIEKQGNGEEQMLTLIDLGAKDVVLEGNLIEVYTLPQQLEEMKKNILGKGFKIKETNLTFKPKTFVPLHGNKKEKLLKFLEQLDDFEDVQKVYCNAEFIE